MQENSPCELSRCFSTVLFFLPVPKCGDSLKEQTEKNPISYTLFFKKKTIPGTLELIKREKRKKKAWM